MRAAAILGLGCSPKDLKPFQTDPTIDWRIGMPTATDQLEIILLFGGDGTIHRHLNQLVKLALPVLIVPAGGGNDFARALGLRNLRDSFRAWRKFCAGENNTRVVDLGVILPLEDAVAAPSATHYFCSVAGVGLDSEVSRRANALPRWMRAYGGYALTLIPSVFGFRAKRMKISQLDECQGWSLRNDQPTTLAAFANSPTYGGGMRIAPQARMGDGRLDVCIIGRISAFKLASVFPTVYFGRHLGFREVDYFQAARLRVETGIPLDLYADGEYVCRTPAEVSVVRGALKVLLP
jgi:diacylglycerol kinase (ATP)